MSSGGAMRAGRGHPAWIVGLACVLAMTARTAAQPADAARPWAAGVSEPEQAIALERYQAGNVEFAEARFAQALAKYREAISHWGHPAIHYNLAVCLIELDQPIEAREALERSLAYGAAPLGAEAYAQAMTYRKLLDGQVARVRIASREPGVQVMLDGKLLLTSPGVAERFVLLGEHQVVASRAGFLTVSRTVRARAGGPTSFDVPALERRETTMMVRRWGAWKPWAVVAGGAALAGFGVWSYGTARDGYAAYDRGIAMRCPGVAGCDAQTVAGFSDLRSAQDHAHRDEVIAFSLFATAGAAVLTGAVGVILNQPRPERAPVLAMVPHGAVLGWSWGWR